MIKSKLISTTKKFFNLVSDDYIIYQLKPDTSVRNQRTEDITKIVAGLFKIPNQRIKIKPFKFFKKGHSFITVQRQDQISFKAVFTQGSITFYLVIPKDKKNEIIRKCEAIWPHATILPVTTDVLPTFELTKTMAASMYYRKHDIFSMICDNRDNLPLPSLLTSIRDLEVETDKAVLDVLFIPTNRRDWQRKAEGALTKLEKGTIPTRTGQQLPEKLFEIVNSIMNSIRYGLLDLTAMSNEDKKAIQQMKAEETRWSEGRKLYDEMLPESKKKVGEDVLNTWVRVAAQSNDPLKAQRIVRTMVNAWKDIAGDNEFDRQDIPRRYVLKFLAQITHNQPTPGKRLCNVLSVKEASKLIQLPGYELQQQFPEIQAIRVKEVTIPNELFVDKGIRIGYVTEKGSTKLVRIPVTPNSSISTSAIYDALCTHSFGQGKQGTGKTEGFGSTWCHDMVVNGFTAIIIDTADGQMIRDFEDSLPEDFPEQKIIHLNCDNKSYPVSLNWSDVLGREFKCTKGDQELQAVEIQERITARFIEFINGEATTEFSDLMRQFLVSATKAATTRKNWSFQDIDLVLVSPSFREELLNSAKIQNMPEVAEDLKRLQVMAEKGSASNTVDGIISRIRMLSNNKLLANMFYQPAKLNSRGKPILDFRKYMDNKPTGDPAFDKYGYVVTIQASYDAWQENQPLILGFFEDKINFNVFSRIELEQKDRVPVIKWIDEPHKVINSVAKYYKGSNVEFRKYRCKNLFTGHSIEQMGDAANSLLDGGAQITSYKTERLSELERFAHLFDPYTDAKELYAGLPDKWVAVNKVRLPSGANCPAFIARMMPPPKKVKDRSSRREDCSKQFGRPWKEVTKEILDRKLHYQKLDAQWYEQKAEEKEAEKQAKKAK